MLLGLGVPEHWISVCLDEKAHIVVGIVSLEATLERLRIPLNVVLGLQSDCALAKVVVLASEHNHRVWVDILLEFGLQPFGKKLRIFFFILFFNLFSFIIKFLFFWRRRRRCDEENIESGLVALRIAVEDVATILAIVLLEPPPESFAHHLLRNLRLALILRKVVVHLDPEVEDFKLIIRLEVVFDKLRELLLIILLTIIGALLVWLSARTRWS